MRGSMVQLVASLNQSVVSLKPIKGSSCFHGHETLPSLLSTGWFQEWVGA